MRHLTIAVVCVSALLSACAQVKLDYQSKLENIEAIKASGSPPLALGQFAAAPELAGKDQAISIRGNQINSAYDNSFSGLLKEGLRKELQAAGKLDQASNYSLSAALTKSNSEAPASGEGSAELAARFVLSKNGQEVFNKTLEERASWPSGFVGATYIPIAINEYTALYQKLIKRLFTDADFKRALQQ